MHLELKRVRPHLVHQRQYSPRVVLGLEILYITRSGNDTASSAIYLLLTSTYSIV